MTRTEIVGFLSMQLGYLITRSVATPDDVADAVHMMYEDMPTGDHWRAVMNAGAAMQAEGDAFMDNTMELAQQKLEAVEDSMPRA